MNETIFMIILFIPFFIITPAIIIEIIVKLIKNYNRTGDVYPELYFFLILFSLIPIGNYILLIWGIISLIIESKKNKIK